MLHVKFKKRRLITNLIVGILWCVLGLVYILYKDDPLFFVLNTLLGLGFLGKYFYEKSKPYIEINENFIIKNSFFNTKRILIEEIRSIKASFDDYLISDEKTEIRINQEMIDKDAYVSLKEELKRIKEQRAI